MVAGERASLIEIISLPLKESFGRISYITIYSLKRVVLPFSICDTPIVFTRYYPAYPSSACCGVNETAIAGPPRNSTSPPTPARDVEDLPQLTLCTL